MMEYFVFLLGILMVCFLSEYTNCYNAELCVKNTGNDTIYYCWAANLLQNTLFPDQITCILVGPIKKNITTKQYTYGDLFSDHSHYTRY